MGSTLNPKNIKEGSDVYFECNIRANPKFNKLVWYHEVSDSSCLFCKSKLSVIRDSCHIISWRCTIIRNNIRASIKIKIYRMNIYCIHDTHSRNMWQDKINRKFINDLALKYFTMTLRFPISALCQSFLAFPVNDIAI